MTRVYVSVGSNIDRESMIRSCMVALDSEFSNMEKSAVYESIAMGFEGDNFYNMVVGFDADDPRQVIEILHAIEQRHGRERGQKKFSPRTLDLDLLLFGQHDLHDQGLDVPRKEILQCAFVLGPLAALAPQEVHPLAGRNYQQLWSEFCVNNPTQVDSIWPINFVW